MGSRALVLHRSVHGSVLHGIPDPDAFVENVLAMLRGLQSRVLWTQHGPKATGAACSSERLHGVDFHVLAARRAAAPARYRLLPGRVSLADRPPPPEGGGYSHAAHACETHSLSF